MIIKKIPPKYKQVQQMTFCLKSNGAASLFLLPPPNNTWEGIRDLGKLRLCQKVQLKTCPTSTSPLCRAATTSFDLHIQFFPHICSGCERLSLQVFGIRLCPDKSHWHRYAATSIPTSSCHPPPPLTSEEQKKHLEINTPTFTMTSHRTDPSKPP